jgi:hypothetical protein
MCLDGTCGGWYHDAPGQMTFRWCLCKDSSRLARSKNGYWEVNNGWRRATCTCVRIATVLLCRSEGQTLAHASFVHGSQLHAEGTVQLQADIDSRSTCDPSQLPWWHQGHRLLAQASTTSVVMYVASNQFARVVAARPCDAKIILFITFLVLFM